MESSVQFIRNSIITVVVVYVITAGLFSIAGVFGWLTWGFIGTWLGNIAIVAGILLAITTVVTLLIGLVKR